DVTLLEAGPSVGTNILDWGHVRLFTPWEMVVSPRMIGTLRAAGLPLPEGGVPTGADLVERVLSPLAGTPPLEGRIHTGARVVSVGRAGLLKHEEIGTGRRGLADFRILVASPDGHEWIVEADLVLDCSGTWGNPNPLGAGGIPALGEMSCTAVSHRIPDVERETAFRGQRTLVVGAGHSAMTAVVELCRMAAENPGTRIYWAVREPHPHFEADAGDPLPLRQRLVRGVADLLRDRSAFLELISGVEVSALRDTEEGTQVTLHSPWGQGRELVVDRIIGLTGSVGDREIYRQLQVHECYATQGPMKLSAALLAADAGADCLDQVSHGAAALANPEPDFYILGSKSYGRTNTFLLRVGYEQISDVFSARAGGDHVAA
ncbi:MAG: flavoprotein, partial [Gemmatimonadota bacterium]|nr:flavoprotein [Gemmatimonadota bacterium]